MGKPPALDIARALCIGKVLTERRISLYTSDNDITKELGVPILSKDALLKIRAAHFFYAAKADSPYDCADREYAAEQFDKAVREANFELPKPPKK